jgi:ribonuclease-3
LDKALSWLAKTLDYQFHDQQLFEQALTHRSASGLSNERLEFLGDAVLDFVVSEFVYDALPQADEGDLSRLRASLVKDTTLAQLASELGLGEHLILGSGERKSGGHRRDSILADALEAVFGAVFLDTGYAASRKVVENAFGDRLRDLPDPSELRDPKSRLQEWLQARQMTLPEYDLVKVTGEPHRQQFEVRCTVVGSKSTATGNGASRRGAEQESAQRMLSNLTESE